MKTDLEQDAELTALAQQYMGPAVSVLIKTTRENLVLVLRRGENAVAAPMPLDSSRAYMMFALGVLAHDLRKVTGELRPLYKVKPS